MDLQKMTEEYRMSEWVRIIKEHIASGDNINKFSLLKAGVIIVLASGVLFISDIVNESW